MAAPCTLAVSKLFYPETEQTKTAIEVGDLSEDDSVGDDSGDDNEDDVSNSAFTLAVAKLFFPGILPSRLYIGFLLSPHDFDHRSPLVGLIIKFIS